MTGNKLRVATKYNGKLNKIEKIINTLKEFPEGTTPKKLAFRTGINTNTIKSLLPEISCIRRGELRGLYHLVAEEGDSQIFNWNFHNCILTCNLPDYSGERIKASYNFGIINYEFEIGAESKQATLRISTDYPMNISSICSCYAFFKVLVEASAEFHPELKDVAVSSIEFNKDYINLRLDGIKSISLENLIEQFKAYQKTNGLRLEHKTKLPFAVEDIVNMLTHIPVAVNMQNEITNIKENQIKMFQFQRDTRDLLGVLINQKNPIKGGLYDKNNK